MNWHRRDFLAASIVAATWSSRAVRSLAAGSMPFRISLAQWSLHKTFYGRSLEIPWERRQEMFKTDPDSVLQGERHPLDFPAMARREFALDGVEYVNTFMYGHADDEKYLAELARRADAEGVTNVLIMCDMEGALGDPDAAARLTAVENHVRWLRAAARLGCHSIRVNAQSRGTDSEQARLAADGLRQLAERADPFGLNVIVENHGGLSSRASWLMDVLRMADHPRLGTLPDFGNFNVSANERYDAYVGVREMMPLARAVSAKSYDFGPDGNELRVDYRQMMKIVTDAGYHSWVGVEYEGGGLTEPAGIKATVDLLQKVGLEMAAK
jgi:sugar phosphate isomerase/epimerase